MGRRVRQTAGPAERPGEEEARGTPAYGVEGQPRPQTSAGPTRPDEEVCCSSRNCHLSWFHLWEVEYSI